MSQGKKRVSVFDYKDYRVFLKDWYTNAKATRKHFSFRSFAKRAGFNTSNFLLLVIKGQRNLTEKSLSKMIQGLELNKQEQEFFRHLTFLNQAKTNDEKNSYYKKLIQTQKFSELKPIERKQYEYYAQWYHPVIRELVCSKDFDGTAEWLSCRLKPKVSASHCAKSIKLLESLGFIKKNGHGYEQASTLVSTGPELTSVVVHNYHKTMLDLSKEVMDTVDGKHRDVSTLTLGIKKEKLAEIRERIRIFRQEILSLIASDTEPEEVVQLNMQLFPLTAIEEEIN